MLDKTKTQERFAKKKAWLLAELARQAENRELASKCESFYDGQQYSHGDAARLRERGQNPVVYNEIKPTIDWMIGTERRTRVDFFVTATEPGDEADEDARVKTKLLKWLDDTNRTGFERSYAVEDALKAGIGWLEIGLRGDKSGPPVYVGAESWRNIVWDSHAQKRDLSDARYIFRCKVVDLDVAIAMFPDKEQSLRAASIKGDDENVFSAFMGEAGLSSMDVFYGSGDMSTANPVDIFNARERIMLIECWCREPMHNDAPGQFGIADPVTFKVTATIMTQSEILLEMVSPFEHNHFPFVPVWGYRNRRTGLPYSPIAQLIGPQEALNHRMSRSIYEASVNQVWIEQGAVNAEIMDVTELRQELDDPAGTAVFANGALSGGKVKDREHKQDARFQVELAARDTQAIRQMSGVAEEQRGLNSNATSGKAVLAKQDQGGLLTLELFDNFLFSRQLEGEMTLSLAEQFLTEPMTINVAGEKSGIDFTQLNQPDGNGGYLNDITARKANFVVGEQAWKQSYAESAFEGLMQVMTQLAGTAPQIVVNLLDVVFEMHPNLPKKAILLERIRAVNGQTPADGKLTPEQEQAKAQQQQQAQAQFEMQMAQMRAQVKEAQSKGDKLDAEAMAKRLESLYMAAQGAQVLAMAPQITPIADELLKSAGFVDKVGAGVIAPTDAAPTAPMPELQQADGAMTGIETPEADGFQPNMNAGA